MNEIAEFLWILYKEYRSVVIHEVPVAFFCIKLYSESARIVFGIGRSFLSTYSRETKHYFGLLSYLQKTFARVCCVMSCVTVKVP